jgi:hypothetical protein
MCRNEPEPGGSGGAPPATGGTTARTGGAGGSVAPDGGGPEAKGGTTGVDLDAGPIECGDDGTGWAPDWQALECELIEAINGQRASGATCAGSPPIPPRPALRPHAMLMANAREHSQDMTEARYFGFQDSLGRDTFEWASQGYEARAVTIAGNFETTSAVLEGVMGSPTDCQNLMGDMRVIGVGYYATTPLDAGTPDAGTPAEIQRNWTIIYAQ